jgi:hypothetical protein
VALHRTMTYYGEEGSDEDLPTVSRQDNRCEIGDS